MVIQPVAGTAKRIWGHEFTWTAQHPDIEEMRKMLYTYDELAIRALDRIDEISPVTPKKGDDECPMAQRNLYTILQENLQTDDVLRQLWNEVTTVPEWVDWEQIQRGQRVIFQYKGQMMLGLFLNSLLGGMSAWRICETLARTGGFGVQVTRRRLLETFQHFLNVIEDLDAIKPGGKGFVSSVQVRLLHGMVRRRMLRLEQERPGYFNIKEWGVPINDLHQIGTINSYSTSLVFISLPRQGIHLEEQQIADCLALWRWVGHIMGTSVDWMSSPGRAKATMESIMVLELDPSRKSQIIANNILTSQVKVPPLYASRGYLAALCWQLNGKDLSQALAIDKPGITHRVLAWSQKWLLSLVSYRYSRLSEEERRKKDEKFLSYGYNIIMSQRHGGLGQTTHFGFQYTPAFDKVTEMGTFAAERSWDLVLALGATVVFVVLIVFGYKAVFPWQQLGGWHAGSLEYLLTRRGS